LFHDYIYKQTNEHKSGKEKKMSEFKSCLRTGSVKFGDDFYAVAEVTALFGQDIGKLPFHNWFKIPGKADDIGCLLSDNGGRGWHNVREFGPKIDSRGWNEVLAITEYNDNGSETQRRIDEELAHPKTRYVFYRERRQGTLWYKFYGVFRMDEAATRASLASGAPAVIYRRVSETVELRRMKEETEMPASPDAAGVSAEAA